MALIKCPECSKDISDKSKNCVGCGCPITDMENATTSDVVPKTTDTQPTQDTVYSSAFSSPNQSISQVNYISPPSSPTDSYNNKYNSSMLGKSNPYSNTQNTMPNAQNVISFHSTKHGSSNGIRIAKLVCGVISLAIIPIILLQSCATGFVNIIESNLDDVSGSAGLFLALTLLVGGIVGIAARKSKGGGITSGLFYFVGAFVGFLNLGTYVDLVVWSVLAFAFSILFILGSVDKIKSKVIWGVLLAVIGLAPILISFSENDLTDLYVPKNITNNGNNNTNQPANNDDNNSTTDPTPQAPSGVEVPDGGIVWFEEDGIVITVMKINRNRDGYVSGIDISVENNSTDDIGVGVLGKGMVLTAVKINNQYSIGTGFGVNVAAGKIAKTEIDIDRDDAVRLFEIKNVYEITADIITYNFGDVIATGVVEYGPHTLTIAQNTSGSSFNNGTLIFSNEHTDVYACNFSVSWLGRTSAFFVLKNKDSTDFIFKLEKFSINGIMEDRWTNESGRIYSNTYRIFKVLLSEDYSEDNIKEIEFTISTSSFTDMISLYGDPIGVVTVMYQNGIVVPSN
ncbi:MAG: TMEM14 family protein [Oscillospiraceae bacterium]|jgi:hypothetical protein|nr:TMEM14 family protein [Oscillospiraceae bacterium]